MFRPASDEGLQAKTSYVLFFKLLCLLLNIHYHHFSDLCMLYMYMLCTLL